MPSQKWRLGLPTNGMLSMSRLLAHSEIGLGEIDISGGVPPTCDSTVESKPCSDETLQSLQLEVVTIRQLSFGDSS